MLQARCTIYLNNQDYWSIIRGALLERDEKHLIAWERLLFGCISIRILEFVMAHPKIRERIATGYVFEIHLKRLLIYVV
jgi:hypothetical protein